MIKSICYSDACLFPVPGSTAELLEMLFLKNVPSAKIFFVRKNVLNKAHHGAVNALKSLQQVAVKRKRVLLINQDLILLVHI